MKNSLPLHFVPHSTGVNTQDHELQPACSPRPGAVGGFVGDYVADVGEFDFPAERRGEGVWIRGAGGNVGRVKAAVRRAFRALSHPELQLGHHLPPALALHHRDVERTHTQVQVYTHTLSALISDHLSRHKVLYKVNEPLLNSTVGFNFAPWKPLCANYLHLQANTQGHGVITVTAKQTKKEYTPLKSNYTLPCRGNGTINGTVHPLHLQDLSLLKGNLRYSTVQKSFYLFS